MRCGRALATRLPLQDSRRRPLETASHRGVALLRPEHHWPSSSTVACSTTRVSVQTAATLSTNFNWCFFCVRTVKAFFSYWNLLFLSSIFKQLLLRNCAVDFVESCNVYVGTMIIKAAKRIFNCNKICRSYSDLNFGVTFLEHSVVTNILSRTVLELLFKFRTLCVFEPPFGGLGTTCMMFILDFLESARRLSISVYWTFFARCYGWVATSAKRSKIGDFAPTRSLRSKISGRRGRPHQSFLHD